MKKRKNIKVWHRGYSGKITIIVLVLGLILLTVSCKPPATEKATPGADGYPPPQNLHITGFFGSGVDRTVNLAWEAPDTEEEVIEYVVYRDDGELSRTTATSYQNVIGDINYDFYVIAIYTGDIKSGPGNVINTETDIGDLPPAGPGTGDDKDNDKDTEPAEDADDKDSDAQDDFNWDEVLSGPCGNPYYPVVMGASHTYNSSNAGTYTSTITSVREDGFTVTHTIGGSTQTHEWECLPEGLVDLSSSLGDAFETMVEGVTITGTSNATGVTIPASISVGDTWSQTYSGTVTAQEFDTGLDFSTTVSYTAMGKETVTIAAGTFEAIRVDSSLKSDFILKTHGTTTPLYTYDSTSSAWFVENIGTVKSTTQGMIKGLGYMEGQLSQEFSDTTELVEFSLP